MQALFSIIQKREFMVNIALIYILMSVLGGAIGQIMLKKGMTNLGEITLSIPQLPGIIWRMFTNPYVFFGLIIYGTGTLFWLSAISRVDLSYAYPFASLSYVIMLIASWLLFSEHISALRLVGTLVICIGVYLIARS